MMENVMIEGATQGLVIGCVSLPEGRDVPSTQRALGLPHNSPRHHRQRVLSSWYRFILGAVPAERSRPWHPLSGMGIGL